MATAKFLTKWLEEMRACYPGGYYDEKSWGKLMRVWTEKLGRFSEEVLGLASGLIVKHHEKHFPSLGAVENICLSVQRRAVKDSEAQQRNKGQVGWDDTDGARTGFRVPSDLPADNPYRVQAEIWEAQIRAGEKLDGTECARILQELLDETPIGEDIADA